jgi:hypothetical protein
MNVLTTNAAAQWAAHVAAVPKGGMASIAWYVVADFLDCLWRRHGFDKPTHDWFSRHWVQHGRRPDVAGQADALRLIVALDCIVMTADALDSVLPKPARKSRKSDPTA